MRYLNTVGPWRGLFKDLVAEAGRNKTTFFTDIHQALANSKWSSSTFDEEIRGEEIVFHNMDSHLGA